MWKPVVKVAEWPMSEKQESQKKNAGPQAEESVEFMNMSDSPSAPAHQHNYKTYTTRLTFKFYSLDPPSSATQKDTLYTPFLWSSMDEEERVHFVALETQQ
ncbi:hypothetical protein Pcinc_021398 [Petrolisthes cinctipes]|uniref:Uncharacterized protein n=1 Tax=Petrolisthes cinctipes TaxID=88211 RepID=A0AAE1KIF9_PETCI|nr:hypothetical protein Pcinc_021398 [Petrolisthes cinctipes]